MTRDYSKGKIYIIKNTVNHLTYIGSTCPKKSLREVATLRREILRHSVARFCDTPSRDFATLRREILRHSVARFCDVLIGRLDPYVRKTAEK